MARIDMRREVKQLRAKVEKRFNRFEKEGFTKTFWSPYKHNQAFVGRTFTVLQRATDADLELCELPAWLILFDTGEAILARPEEVINSIITQYKEGLCQKGN